MSDNQLLYESNKKSVAVALLLTIFIPGAAYAYNGKWLLMIAAWGLLLAFSAIGVFAQIGMWGLLVIDAILATQRHNKQLAARLVKAVS